MVKEKAIIYARVSSKEQEIGGFSIPAQLDILKKYCKEHNFEVSKIYTEAVSAKETGQRPAYDEMMKFLRKNKKTSFNLVYEKNDRLLRNEYDSADIINLARTTSHFIHSVREMLILHKNAHPSVFYMFTMFSANSSIYSRNLSLEVKKGMNKSAELGYYPSLVPIGYKRGDRVTDEKRKREIVIDSEKAGYIIKTFELYATGMYSYKTLADKLAQDGFKIRTNSCKKANIEKIINNPFYIGEFIYNGKRYYSNRYTPIISKELFLECQKIKNNQLRPRKLDHNFLYSNMIKCSKCGCSLVGQLQKGKYIYYTCMGRKCDLKRSKYLKQETVDLLVEEFLKSITVPEENVQIILDKIKEIVNKQFEYEENANKNIEQKINLLKKRLNKLYLDKLDEVISEDFYIEKRDEFQSEIDNFYMQLQKNSFDTEEIMEKSSLCIELLKNAYNKYLQLNDEQKRIFLKFFVLNFSYDGQKLSINLKSTAESMFIGANFNKWWALRDLNS